MLQPVLVREIGDERFELIAGERRWRAAKRAGLPSIPVVVREVDEVLSLEQALVENLHREDLNPLEEAAAYQQLMEDFELTQEAVAQKVGKSRSAVANTLRLFQLPPTIQRLVAENQLSGGHAKALLGTPDRAFQEALAKQIVAEGLSVREAEEAVRRHNEEADEDAEDAERRCRRRPPRRPPSGCGRRACSSSRSSSRPTSTPASRSRWRGATARGRSSWSSAASRTSSGSTGR